MTTRKTPQPILLADDQPETPHPPATQAAPQAPQAAPPEPAALQPRQTEIATPAAPQPAEAVPADMFERLARDPNVPVDKLERLIALQERVLDRDARMAFSRAFSAMQEDLPVIARTAETDKTTFAPLDEIVRRVRPVLKKHGFSYRWSTDFVEDWIVVTCHLSHEAGHTETSKFRGKADKTGSKNDVQAQGSTVSYGRRYTLLDVLGVATGEADDDGEGSEPKEQPQAPHGWEDWALTLETVAEDGFDALMKMWRASSEQNRNHMMGHYRNKWERVKQAAMVSDRKAGRQPVVRQGGGGR